MPAIQSNKGRKIKFQTSLGDVYEGWIQSSGLYHPKFRFAVSLHQEPEYSFKLGSNEWFLVKPENIISWLS